MTRKDFFIDTVLDEQDEQDLPFILQDEGIDIPSLEVEEARNLDYEAAVFCDNNPFF
jgi:hypothetical protein